MKRQYPLGLLQPNTRTFIILWREKKKYETSNYICLCEVIELLLGTQAHYRDTSFSEGLTFDHILDLRELKIGYDGESFLEIAIWYLEDYVKSRVAKAQLLM